MNIFILTKILNLIREKKISILISTFNKFQFIKKTIASCLNQNYKNYEIIIIDTESTDGTIEVLGEYSKLNKIKVRYIKRRFKKSPLNQIQAIKSGLAISKGEIICLLDGDDNFKKNKLKEINKFFSKNPNINFVQDILTGVNKSNKYNNSRSFFSLFKILPKFFPTSTFSIKKNKLVFFLKRFPFNNLDLLEIDARLYFFSKIIKNDHLFINKNLTIYMNDPNGISSKYKKFSSEWFKKRKQAHFFLKSFFKNNIYPYKLDFFISKLMFLLIKKF